MPLVPRRVATRVLALAAFVFCVVPRPASTFDLQRHAAMTYTVLGYRGVGAVARGIIAFGAMLPDIQDCIPSCYCDFAPRACQPLPGQLSQFGADHFDNNLLDESIYRVNDRMAIAQAGVEAPPGDWLTAGRALIAFGKALHTTQDFYAHSTWFEINIPPIGPINLFTWQGQPYALYSWHNANLTGNGSLQTGFYIAGAPAGGYTHDQLNKDNPGSPEGSQRIAGNSYYSWVSGDGINGGGWDSLGLAPQHTLNAYQALYSGGLLFPYVFGAAGPQRAADALRAQRVANFFAWVEQDTTLQKMAAFADTLIAHARADSIDLFPTQAIDANDLPNLALLSADEQLPPQRGALLAPARPNPFRDATTLRYVAPAAGRVQVGIYDVSGRRLRTLADAEVGSGPHELTWDGRDDDGRMLRAGVYRVRFAGLGRNESQAIVFVR